MKNPIILSTLLAGLLTACQPINEADTSGDVTLNDNYKQIAFNFRSESEIVIEEGSESYMGRFDNRAMLDEIFEAIYAGKIKAYNFLDDPLSIEEVKYMQSHSDTAEVEDIETGELEMVLITEELNPDEVIKIFTVEDWFLDTETFMMKKKMISMTLTTLKFNREGDPFGYEILFKIYLDGRDQLP